MSPRTHAVVVQPDQWSGAPAELARLLAPITGADVVPLTDALARGPMTVEADLSAEDARALADRLVQMGVPAVIQPDTTKVDLPETGAVPSGLEVERARITDEVPRARRSTMMGHKPMVTGDPDDEADEENGWGAVFPDLGARREEIPAPRPSVPAKPPSLDELEGTAPPNGKHGGDAVQNEPSAHDTVASQSPGQRELTPPLTFEAEDAGEPKTPDSRATPEPASPKIQQETPPSQPPSRGADKKPLKPEGFDPSRLAALMPEDEGEQPPYKPSGFDPRPEHHPPFATMFAVLAPGAGHVFNGDDDDAIALGLRGWLLVPWVRSVRGVRDKAERIRTYWAPRPEEGNGLRAFRFVFAWWLCVALIGATLAWGAPAVIGLLDYRPPPPEGPTAEEIQTAFDSAHTTALSARVAALDALEEATKDVIPDPKYTMTDEERGERLFAIGYLECRRRSHAMCEAMMKRVLQLKPAFRPALKLQAWASVSRNGRPEPMPDIGDVPTLNQLELEKMREEMILEGEHVPPPPEPGEFDFAAPAADAGTNTQDAGEPPAHLPPDDVGNAP